MAAHGYRCTRPGFLPTNDNLGIFSPSQIAGNKDKYTLVPQDPADFPKYRVQDLLNWNTPVETGLSTMLHRTGRESRAGHGGGAVPQTPFFGRLPAFPQKYPYQ